MRSRILHIGIAVSCAATALLLGAGAVAQTPSASEYQVKAVLIFNFAQFVIWPATAPDSQASVVVCIVGDDPFGNVIDETLRGERVGGRSFEVRRFRDVANIPPCEVLFISRSDAQRVGGIITDLRNRPTLTVSDAADFAKLGGMIQFVTERNRVRLKINLQAAQDAKLTISSKLLRVAEIVRSSRR